MIDDVYRMLPFYIIFGSFFLVAVLAIVFNHFRPSFYRVMGTPEANRVAEFSAWSTDIGGQFFISSKKTRFKNQFLQLDFPFIKHFRESKWRFLRVQNVMQCDLKHGRLFYFELTFLRPRRRETRRLPPPPGIVSLVLLRNDSTRVSEPVVAASAYALSRRFGLFAKKKSRLTQAIEQQIKGREYCQVEWSNNGLLYIARVPDSVEPVKERMEFVQELFEKLEYSKQYVEKLPSAK